MVLAAWASVLVGVGLAAYGLHLDDAGWWAAHPYAANMYSAFSGALIGVPLSGLVLAAVLDHGRRFGEAVRTLFDARDATADLGDGVLRLLGGGDPRHDPYMSDSVAEIRSAAEMVARARAEP